MLSLRRFIPLICAAILSFACAAHAQDGIAPGIDSQSAPKSSSVSPEVKQRLLALVPSPAPANAVLQQEATAFYTPENLYQYMDGGADIYLLYDFKTLLHQEFKAVQVDVTVDLFDMGATENGFGMYASERSPSYQFISMGTEGYRNQGILNFVKGRYYVKLAGFGIGADAVLDEFARAVASRIDEKAEFPSILQKLPQANRKPRSEQYLPKDPLGHAFLGPAYLVSYADESTLLVSIAPNAAEAQQRLGLLTDHFKKTGKCTAAPDLADGAIRASNSFEGNVLAAARGNVVVVVYTKNAGSEAILRETLRAVQ